MVLHGKVSSFIFRSLCISDGHLRRERYLITHVVGQAFPFGFLCWICTFPEAVALVFHAFGL